MAKSKGEKGKTSSERIRHSSDDAKSSSGRDVSTSKTSSERIRHSSDNAKSSSGRDVSTSKTSGVAKASTGERNPTSSKNDASPKSDGAPMTLSIMRVDPRKEPWNTIKNKNNDLIISTWIA